MTDRIDAAVERKQPRRANAALDRRVIEPDPDELLVADYAVLALRDRRDPRIYIVRSTLRSHSDLFVDLACHRAQLALARVAALCVVLRLGASRRS
jgi:hypothetical protein